MQKDDLSTVQEIMDRIKDNVQQNETILQNFQEQSEHMRLAKMLLAAEERENIAQQEKNKKVLEGKKTKKPTKGK